MIGSRLAHYEIVEKIGAGGMGEVYRARDTKLGRDVALKLLPEEMSADPERRKRFEREAKAIASLNHPNIVTIYSVEESQGRHFLTMELVDGKTVSDLLPADGFSLEQFFRVSIPLADAINSAHAAGITHRDLKPANVMIDANGRVKVLDFGLAKLREPGDAQIAEAETVVNQSDTQEGRVLGTTAYMSPEQAEGKTVDGRSDIFSLGILLYEMATGERPFKGDSNLSLLSSILKDTPSTITDVRRHLPVQLGRIIQHCLEKDPRKRFQSALDIANELEALKLEVSSATGAVEAVRVSKPFMRGKGGILGAAAFVVIVAAVLIFRPFQGGMSPDGASARGNTLAIMYFENLVDPADSKRHGEIIAELLITGLSESDHVRVVSSQRLYDLLKQLGKEGDRSIDRSTATEVATKAGARWMMQGRILQVEPTFVVTSQIVEVASGNVAASQRITGEAGESIFALVDRITDETVSDLAGSGEPIEASPPSVAAVSTNSEEAYRYYLAGVEYERKLFSQEARDSYRMAVHVDSTFAMAYYRLSYNSIAQGEITNEESNEAIRMAVRHIDRATTKEQMYIRAADARRKEDMAGYAGIYETVLEEHPDDKHALRRLGEFYAATGDYDRAIEYANRVLEHDPLDKIAYNGLAYTYNFRGDFDKAIWALDKYIELAPDEPNPWDSRGDIYAENGYLDEAMASYAKAIEIKPDFADYASVAKLGLMYMFKGDYDRAGQEYRKIFASNDPRIRSRARGWLVTLSAYRGQIPEALEQLDATMSADEMEGLGDPSRWQRLRDRAFFLEAVGETDAARSALKESHGIRPETGAFASCEKAYELISLGQFEEAAPLLAPFRARADSLPGFLQTFMNLIFARIEFEKQNYDGAVSYLERDETNWFWRRFPLAEAYFEAGRMKDAIRLLELLSQTYSVDRAVYSPDAVRIHYYLGVAYQKTGRNAEAVEQFERFLSIWENADPRLEGLDDARKRLAILKTSS